MSGGPSRAMSLRERMESQRYHVMSLARFRWGTCWRAMLWGRPPEVSRFARGETRWMAIMEAARRA